MIDDPRLRVFHIDTECYIIYVGKNPNDYRPFLRVGNSRFLPEKARKLISAVIITDSLTGNQLIEHENLQIPLNGETRYIGDPDEVAKLKQFLEDNEIPSEGYTNEDIQDMPPEKSGAFVYFYKNGNMQLFHDKERLFDLQDREKEDSHFIYRVEKTVQAVKSNPFRYLPSDLVCPGFFFSGEHPFFFREGKIGTLGISVDYFRDLGKYGFDPDLLSWLVEDRISEGLLCRFKRATVTKKDIRVATLDLRKFRNAVSLFTSSGLSCIIVHLEPGEEKVFSGFSLRRREMDLAVVFPAASGFPEVVFPENSETSEGHVLREVIKNAGVGGAAFHPVEGVPYRIIDKADEDTDVLIKTYLLDVAAELKDMEDAAGQELLKSLETLCRALTSPRGSAAAKVLSDAKNKNTGDKASEKIVYLLWNIHEFARLCSARKGISAGLMKNAGRLDALVARPVMPLKNATHLPALGDLYKNDKDWYVFYRWNGVLTKLKLLQAQKSSETIEKLGVHDNESFYVSERQRFISFIGGLMEPPPGRKKPLPPEIPVRDGPAGNTAAAVEKPAVQPEKKTLAAVTAARPEKKIPARPAEALTKAKVVSGSGQPVAEVPAAAAPAAVSQSSALRSTINKAFQGKFLLPALAIVALGGGSFLLLRSCSGASAQDARTGQESVQNPGAPAASAPGVSSPPPAAGPSAARPETPSAPSGQSPETTVPASGAPAVSALGESSPPPAADPSAARPETPSAPSVQSPGTTVPASGAPAASAPGVSSPPPAAGPSAARPETSAAPSGQSPGTAAPPPGAAAASPRPAREQTPPAGDPAARAGAAAAGIDPASIHITVLDIYYCVNEIAVKNGYSSLNGEVRKQRDPNWIYPGRTFVLPDNTVYVIELQDTLWEIAEDYIRENIRELCRAYDELLLSYGPGQIPAGKREDVSGGIRNLITRSRSENLRRVFEEKIRNL